MVSQHFFHVWIDFKTKKEISERPFIGGSVFKDKCRKGSSVCFLKQETKQLLQVFISIYQSNQFKMNTSIKFSDISISEKRKTRGLKHIAFLFSEA